MILHCCLKAVADQQQLLACLPATVSDSLQGQPSALLLPLLLPSGDGDFHSKYGIQIPMHDPALSCCIDTTHAV